MLKYCNSKEVYKLYTLLYNSMFGERQLSTKGTYFHRNMSSSLHISLFYCLLYVSNKNKKLTSYGKYGKAAIILKYASVM